MCQLPHCCSQVALRSAKPSAVDMSPLRDHARQPSVSFAELPETKPQQNTSVTLPPADAMETAPLEKREVLSTTMAPLTQAKGYAGLPAETQYILQQHQLRSPEPSSIGFRNTGVHTVQKSCPC